MASIQPTAWHPEVTLWLEKHDYSKASAYYEQLIEQEPETRSLYWYLGLLFLLQGQEAEAQTTWLMSMAEGEADQIETWTAELAQILATEASRQESLRNFQLAWLVRQHLREVQPGNVNNLLQLTCLAAELDRLAVDDFAEWGVVEALEAAPAQSVDFDQLLRSLLSVLHHLPPYEIVVTFVKAALPQITNNSLFMGVLLPEAVSIAHSRRLPGLAAELLELYLQVDPNNLEILGHLATFYQNDRNYERGIEVAQARLKLEQPALEKAHSSHLLLRGLMNSGGHWQQVLEVSQQHHQILSQLTTEDLAEAHPSHITRLFTAPYFFPYIKDELKYNRTIQNQVMQLAQYGVREDAAEQANRFQTLRTTAAKNPTKSQLRIGYLSHCMRRHSVGWLARWLLEHHDREQVQLYGYFIYESKNDSIYTWYASQFDQVVVMSRDCDDNPVKLAERIDQDEVDILIDLDSITLDVTCQVLALKPAPIQVTWLGWDAPGIPAVDYFLADPYVLPDWAQEYYPEKIWRLPQTYIAVDGFEVGVPTLRRDDLDIPADATVYLSAQRGFKRHPDTTRLQMQILKEVPDSYFLIKGIGDERSLQKFFTAIAESVGVDSNRLRFLPEAPGEGIHRANLAIADVVLDTFPYNGATTTLETLWMGVPLVTRVGDQFASRNSYTMLVNAGISEGIAWSDEEYVQWGARLGQDHDLRQQIHWKLLRSRQTAPLWNGKAFTREVENAYRQMWQIYCNS